MVVVESIEEYVQNRLKNTKIILAVKVTPVTARRGILGEHITTYSDGLHETDNVVGVDDEGELDWVVSNSDENVWVVTNKVFQKSYIRIVDTLYSPIQSEKKFIQIDEDIEFIAPWGEKMKIYSGGYLRVDDLNQIYGIQKKDFDATYKILD